MKAIKISNYSQPQLGETAIIKRILNGEKELYEILLRRNNQKLFRAIRSYLKNMEEIEDIMQNTYLKAFEKLHQFKYNSQFSTWLIKIGINEALALLKAKGKIVRLYDQSIDFENKKILDMPDKEQLNPERKIIRQEAKQILEHAIDGLDIKYRTVYVLREIEGMNTNEISECLGITNSNVKVRLHRAKAMIKEQLYELSVSKDVFGFGFEKCDRLVDLVMKKIL